MKNSLQRLIIKNAGKYFSFLIVVFLMLNMGCESKAQNPNVGVSSGGKFTYAIKKGMKIGEATITFGEEEAGQDAFLIVFQGRAPKFYDEERIYADKKSFYPVTVKRDVNFLGKKEKITESYQENGEIKIVKEAKTREEQVLRRQAPVDNIYCFLHRYRTGEEAKIGDTFKLNLPTKNVELKVIEKTTIKIMGKEMDAFYLESNPKQYKLWIDVSPERLPLRIEGATGPISASLILTDYQP